MLNFSGAYFDPLYALTHFESAKQYLPRPRVRPLDNISKCRVLLPVSDPNYLHIQLNDKEKGAQANERAKKLRETRKREDDIARKAPNSLRGLPDRLASNFARGPMSLLRRCYMERRKVNVHFRRQHSFGILIGYVLAFDKHMNMVLSDCLEKTEVVVGMEWSPREEDVVAAKARGKRELSSKARRRLVRRPLLEKRERHFHQTMLRGDNIVLVAVAAAQ